MRARIVAVIVASVLVIAIVGVVLISSDSRTNGGAATIRTVSRNTTIHGELAVIGICEPPSSTCPIGATPGSASLVVELIEYNGTYYYVHSGTLITGGTVTETSTNSTGGVVVTTSTSSEVTVDYTVWFTNSTLYCVTPNLGTATMTCPG